LGFEDLRVKKLSEPESRLSQAWTYHSQGLNSAFSDTSDPQSLIVPIDFDGDAKEICFALLPNFTMLAFNCAVEVLRIANRVTGKELYRWSILTEDGRPIRCSNGLAILPDGPLKNLQRDTQIFACSGNNPADYLSRGVGRWLREQRGRGCKLGSMCTGAFSLAAASLLDGSEFTLHWEYHTQFREQFWELEQPSQETYVIDKNLMTSAGGLASTDMMLRMVENDHGKRVATVVAAVCNHTRSTAEPCIQKSGLVALNVAKNTRISKAIEVMEQTIEDPISTKQIAKISGTSVRQLERQFKEHLGRSPAKFYIDIRLDRARELLGISEMRVSEVAAATGFGTTSLLAQRFKSRFGVSPREFRTL